MGLDRLLVIYVVLTGSRKSAPLQPAVASPLLGRDRNLPLPVLRPCFRLLARYVALLVLLSLK
ncbi:hypothetical protein B1748_03780 [Paenibacillus sp. MY03]|nr:hypothetical protein B1748_03780 [Paenibacillus sp. MY03]